MEVHNKSPVRFREFRVNSWMRVWEAWFYKMEIKNLFPIVMDDYITQNRTYAWKNTYHIIQENVQKNKWGTVTPPIGTNLDYFWLSFWDSLLKIAGYS